MKLKNIGIRSFFCDGKWISPGEEVTVSKDSNWLYHVEKGYATAKNVSINERYYTREELEKKSMSELREIGTPIGAKDTKKSELIDEILEKQG